MCHRSKLLPGTLCKVSPRGRAVWGYEIFGAYYDEAEGYRSMKSTGDALLIAKNCGKSMPFMHVKKTHLPQGTVVVVVHPPISISSLKARTRMSLTRTSTVCEVLDPADGRTRWVKSGLLKVVM